MERFLKIPNRIYLRQLSMPRDYCGEKRIFRRAFLPSDLTEYTTEREIDYRGGGEYVTKISKSCNTTVTKGS
jgi:hypothetical protein